MLLATFVVQEVYVMYASGRLPVEEHIGLAVLDSIWLHRGDTLVVELVPLVVLFVE